jgi:ABC-2 type transport system permease protein
MYNLRTVVGFELIRTIKRKSFWVSTLAIPALIAALIGVSYFSAKAVDKHSAQQDQQKFSVVVQDDSKLLVPAILKAAGAKTITSQSAGIAKVQSGQFDAFFYYPANPTKDAIQVYAKDVGLIDNSKYTDVATQLLQASVEARIGSPEKLALINTPATTDLRTYSSGSIVDDSIDRAIPPAFFLLLFYLVIILLGNQMLSSTTEEKENRVIEMILTSVSSTSLIVGKILAMMVVGVLQLAVIMVPTIIAYVYFRSSLSIPNLDLSKLVFDPGQIAVAALAFFGGFLVFTGLLVAIGAAMPTAKEANRFFGVAVLAMVAPVYAIGAIITSPNVQIVKVFTFFPLTAPVTLILRDAAGNLTGTEAAGSLAIILVASVLAIAIAIRTFKYGTLQYSRKLTLQEIFGNGLIARNRPISKVD